MPRIGITISNGDAGRAMVAGRTVSVTFDHAALVTAGRSRADALDVAVYFNSERLNVFVYLPNSAAARVFFCLREEISASGSTTKYKLGFGNVFAQDLAPIPIRDLSQYHPWLGTDDTNRVPEHGRIQPFLFFDHFSHKRSGGAWVAYSGGDAVDSAIYGKAGTWTVTSSLLEHNYAAAPDFVQVLMTGSTLTALRKRVWVGMRMVSPITAPLAGALMWAQGTPPSLDAFAAGAGTVATFGILGYFQAGVATPLDAGAIADVTNRWILVGSFADNETGEVHAIVDTWASATASAKYDFGSGGVFDNSVGAGKLQVDWLAIEEWDGVLDSDVTVTLASIGDPGLPTSTPFPLDYADGTAVASNTFPEFPNSRAVSVHPFNNYALQITYPVLTAEEYCELRALRAQLKGNVGTFSAAIPGYGTATYRMVEFSGSPLKFGEVYEASIVLEKASH